MGLLDGTNHLQYYQGNNYGNYQFTSLQDIIDQFMVAYVGEDKIISKVKRTDVAFHAQRGLAELSFDTFRSIKTQQIDAPASLTMPLPHDYVNYTRIMSVDSAGIKHPLYPTRDTQNPFQIAQEDDGTYTFAVSDNEVTNGSFIKDLYPTTWSRLTNSNVSGNVTDNEELQFKHKTKEFNIDLNNYWGVIGVVFQEIDVSDQKTIDLSATGLAVAQPTGGAQGILRVGITAEDPNSYTDIIHVPGINESRYTYGYQATGAAGDSMWTDGLGGYLEWDSDTPLDQVVLTPTKADINVENFNKVWVLVVSYMVYDGSDNIADKELTNKVDNITVTASSGSIYLTSPVGNEVESSTWQSYKSTTPSENNNDDYEDDTYWPNKGERYGLDPSRAQVNGSFFIDQRLGKIHFSSNISGKTIVLDYISDSLGTDGEMQVHKFAEEAMYKWIMHAVLSTRINIPEYQVNRLKKERFAAIRQAKLRLSNVKLEEITQILRGKSKQIKH